MVTPAKVANSSQGELLIITYNLLLTSLNNIKKDKTEEIQNSRNIIQVLIETLDFNQDLAQELLSIYVYINKILIKNLIKYDEKLIDEAIELVTRLLEGWEQVVAKEKNKEKSMDNAQDIYAGLTYGKNELKESVTGNNNRGFRA